MSICFKIGGMWVYIVDIVYGYALCNVSSHT